MRKFQLILNLFQEIEAADWSMDYFQRVVADDRREGGKNHRIETEIEHLRRSMLWIESAYQKLESVWFVNVTEKKDQIFRGYREDFLECVEKIRACIYRYEDAAIELAKMG